MLSREEIEVDAARAIEARVGLGRPPQEDFKPVEARLAEIDAEMAARPRLEPFPIPPVPAAHAGGGGEHRADAAVGDRPLEVARVSRRAASGAPMPAKTGVRATGKPAATARRAPAAAGAPKPAK